MPVITGLDFDKEQAILRFFNRPVRLHLLFKATHHRPSVLFERFDDDGDFVIIAYLLSGIVRGAYLKIPIDKTTVNAFLINLTKGAPRVYPRCRTDSVAVTFNLTEIAFGKSFRLLKDYSTYVCFSSCEVFRTNWVDERDTIPGSRVTDVELFRVQDAGNQIPPWREVSWSEGTSKDLRKTVVSHSLITESLNSARVLLLGPEGHGKSSFVNSVRSVIYQRILHLPIIGSAPAGFTNKLKSYNIRAERGGVPTSLILCDMPPVSSLGITDILAIVNGHVSDGYKFISDSPIGPTDSYYRADPKMIDRIHCVAFCLSASDVMDWSEEQQKTYRQLHKSFSDLNIPQVILLTQVDLVCHAVNEDVRYVYQSRTVQMRMQQAADLVGLPVAYVFPVKNYSSELSVSSNTDILLLSALQRIQDAVDDALEDAEDTPPPLSIPSLVSPTPPPSAPVPVFPTLPPTIHYSPCS